MRDDIAAYNDRHVIVFGVNGGSARSHRGFARRLHLPIPLLVDRHLKVARRYNAVWGPSFIPIIKRTVVGVDPDGRIVFYRRGIPSTAEILDGLRREPAP